MSLPLRIHPEAEAEFAEAIRWYQNRGVDLATDFVAAVNEGMAAIQRHSSRYPLVRAETRRTIIRRFPYAIFYTPELYELNVLAIYHASRDPTGWYNRR